VNAFGKCYKRILYRLVSPAKTGFTAKAALPAQNRLACKRLEVQLQQSRSANSSPVGRVTPVRAAFYSEPQPSTFHPQPFQGMTRQASLKIAQPFMAGLNAINIILKSRRDERDLIQHLGLVIMINASSKRIERMHFLSSLTGLYGLLYAFFTQP
jgi:hypothetical protein